MTHTSDDGNLFTQLCRRGILEHVLEEYVAFCQAPPQNRSSEDAPNEKRTKAHLANPICRFPNIAGFCRYLGASPEEWQKAEESFPLECGRIRAVLEDEALNAALSPTVLGAYLKKRLGYEKDGEISGSVSVYFEHDILSDGE